MQIRKSFHSEIWKKLFEGNQGATEEPLEDSSNNHLDHTRSNVVEFDDILKTQSLLGATEVSFQRKQHGSFRFLRLQIPKRECFFQERMGTFFEKGKVLLPRDTD